MKIVVLIKQVPDTYGERVLSPDTGWVDRAASDRVIDEINERALEVALTYKDSAKNTEIVLVTMGPAEAKDALRKGLSMGADSAVHILDDSLEGSDALATATTLAASLKREGFDLIVTGNESTDGRGGVVPAMVAELLGVPSLSFVSSVVITDDRVSGVRSDDTQTLQVHAPLPALISITEGSPDARFPSFKGIMTAKRKPLSVLSFAELGAEHPSARSRVVSNTERPARAAGRTITDDGSAGSQLVDYLVAERLI
ncbi:MAG: electron transfer flavoprotein beta-subunit [Subtercola sp.]|nr:electron transfer flavoprotein beta-subunit [Subtercola sp.]